VQDDDAAKKEVGEGSNITALVLESGLEVPLAPKELNKFLAEHKGLLLSEGDFEVLEQQALAHADTEYNREILRALKSIVQSGNSRFEVGTHLLPLLRKMPAASLAGRLGEERSLVTEYGLTNVEESFAREAATHLLEEMRIERSLEAAREANRIAVSAKRWAIAAFVVSSLVAIAVGIVSALAIVYGALVD
jgi:hypothetical protein